MPFCFSFHCTIKRNNTDLRVICFSSFLTVLNYVNLCIQCIRWVFFDILRCTCCYFRFLLVLTYTTFSSLHFHFRKSRSFVISFALAVSFLTLPFHFSQRKDDEAKSCNKKISNRFICYQLLTLTRAYMWTSY